MNLNNSEQIEKKLKPEIQKLNHTSETSSELQMYSEAANVQMGYKKSKIPLEDMMSFMEESIFEEQSKEQGSVLKKIINPNKK